MITAAPTRRTAARGGEHDEENLYAHRSPLRRARRAADDGAVAADHRIACCARVDETTLSSRSTPRARKGAGGAGIAHDVAVVVGTRELAMTVGTAVAGAIFARARAVRVFARAVHVTGSPRAFEAAASTASAAAFGVGASARARIAVAVDVAGRGAAGKVAVALRAARTGAVAACAGALVVVALAIDVTRRLFAFEFARLARRAHARSVVAIVVVAAGEEGARTQKYGHTR